MTQNDELKPCPFCGGGTTDIKPNEYWTGQDMKVLSFSLTHVCESRLFFSVAFKGKEKEDVIEQWNTRQQDTGEGLDSDGIIEAIDLETGHYDEIEYEPAITVTGKALWDLRCLAVKLLSENDALDEACHKKSLEIISAKKTQQPQADASAALEALDAYVSKTAIMHALEPDKAKRIIEEFYRHIPIYRQVLQSPQADDTIEKKAGTFRQRFKRWWKFYTRHNH